MLVGACRENQGTGKNPPVFHGAGLPRWPLAEAERLAAMRTHSPTLFEGAQTSPRDLRSLSVSHRLTSSESRHREHPQGHP